MRQEDPRYPEVKFVTYETPTIHAKRTHILQPSGGLMFRVVRRECTIGSYYVIGDQ